MGKATKRRTVFPYFKAQVIDSRTLAWMDARKEAFDSLDQCRSFLATGFSGRRTRIVIVERGGRRVLENVD